MFGPIRTVWTVNAEWSYKRAAALELGATDSSGPKLPRGWVLIAPNGTRRPLKRIYTPLWHSPVTGLYGIKREPLELWTEGGTLTLANFTKMLELKVRPKLRQK
jgi:hypothetical protein